MHEHCLKCLGKKVKDPAHRIENVDCVNCSTVKPIIGISNLYFCSICGMIVPKEEIVSSECPWCRTPTFKHKICGGKATQK